MPEVTFDGGVVEQTSHLRYLWSTLTECWLTKSMWKQQHWSARKVYQSWRLWLQMVLNNTSSYCIKVWCSVSLWTWPHNNGMDKSAKAGQSAEQGSVRHTGNHQGHTHWDHVVHARPPTNANQTVSGAGQSMLQCHQKSPQPIPWSHEEHKGMQTGWGKFCMGQIGYSILQCCQLTELKQTKEWEGTQIDFGLSMRHSCQKTWESTVENEQQATLRVEDLASCSKKQQTTKPHSVCRWLSHGMGCGDFFR